MPGGKWCTVPWKMLGEGFFDCDRILCADVGVSDLGSAHYKFSGSELVQCILFTCYAKALSPCQQQDGWVGGWVGVCVCVGGGGGGGRGASTLKLLKLYSLMQSPD